MSALFLIGIILAVVGVVVYFATRNVIAIAVAAVGITMLLVYWLQDDTIGEAARVLARMV